MTNAEYQLKVALEQALEVAEHLDELDTIVDEVMKALKEGEYFIHSGTIFKVLEADWTDQSDGWANYDLYVEDED
jgi:hypothetical protein